ncbi:hypothetical protein NC651_035710 [Populus alba x Populus x berolinensis]|nr:hypothetical protein NC651_035710 [Populus alba x Populus x berolinensis]
MMALLLKKRKRICFTNKIDKRPAIVVNVSFQLGFFFFFFQLQPSILLPLFNPSLLLPLFRFSLFLYKKKKPLSQ